MKKVGIIIRTLNEGKWLDLCLTAINKQTYENFQIIGVDSGSEDLTLEIFKKYNVKMDYTSNYTPGSAINLGIACSHDCDYYVILSAHCIPVNSTWLECFVHFMELHPSVAGAYGNQYPMTFTNNENTRDLVVTFREETNVNRNMFFHNANSIIRRDAVQKVPFDDNVKHIEDIVWSRNILAAGFDLGYVKEAGVTHYHGTNQHPGGYSSVRSKGLNDVFGEKSLIRKFSLHDLFAENELKVQRVCLSSECSCNQSSCISIKKNYINSTDYSIADLIKKVSLDCIRSRSGIIALQVFKSCSTIDETEKWRDEFVQYYPNAIIPVKADYGNYWCYDGENIEPIQSSLDKRSKKHKILREELLKGSVIQINALFNQFGKIKDPILKEV